LDAEGTDQIHVPDGGWILSAKFVRQGPDLLLVGQDGSKVLIKSFFKFADPPDLITPDGAVINGPLASKLAGPAAPGMEAQAAPAAAAAEPIGKIVTVSGKVEATRADGTKVELKVGDPVYQGDVIETGALGAVGMEFADESTFSLADNGRMVLDEMVYDPATDSGQFGASIVQGAFSFISGQIAKTGPDNMLINTPTATIGIRGTALAGRAAPEGEQSSFTILPEGNFVGEVVISNDAGTVVLNQVGATVSIASFNIAPPPPIVISAQQIQQQYSNVLRALPPSGDGSNPVPGQQGTPEGDAPPPGDASDVLDQLQQAINQGAIDAVKFNIQLQNAKAIIGGTFENLQNMLGEGAFVLDPVTGLTAAEFRGLAENLRSLALGPHEGGFTLQSLQAQLSPQEITAIQNLIGAGNFNSIVFNSASFNSVNEALALLNNAAVVAANAETAASAAVSSLTGSLSILGPNAGLSTTDTDSVIEVVVAPLEALNAARALSEALVTMIQSAQAMLSVAASGGEIDANTLTALRNAVGLDGAAGDNLVTSATEISAVVNAAIAAANQAKTDAINAAGSGVAAARTAAATSFSNNINSKLTAAGAVTTDINNLQDVVNIVTTKVTAIRDVVQSNPALPAELLTVLNLAVQAADAADQAATAAQGTLNTTDPTVMLAAKTNAITAAQTVNGLKAQAISAYDSFAATRTVDPAVIANFQQAIQDANTAETAADEATSAIEGASQAREAAQAYKDGTAQADLTAKQAATATARTAAEAEKGEAVTAANNVQEARADLLIKLIDEAVDQATFEAFEDAAKSAEAIQKGASDGDKGDVDVSSDGSLSYVVDQSNAAISALNAGDSTTDTFKIAIENSSGGFDLQIITVTITNDGGTIVVSDDVTVTSGSGDSLTTVSGTLSGLTADAAQQNLDAALAALEAANTAKAEATAAANATPGNATLEAQLALATQNQANAQAAVNFQEDVRNLFQDASQKAQARARGIGDGDKGEVTFDADGNVVYTPDADSYSGLNDGDSATDSFLIAAQNDAGGYDISTVQVTVTNNGGTLTVSNATTVTAPDGTTASVNLDALDDVTAGNVGYINGADQVADASSALANTARTNVDTLEATAQTELSESLAAIDALATAQSAEAQAEGYLSIAQAAAEAQAEAALEIAVADVSTLTNQLSLLADAVNAYADAAQANAIVGTADKVAANAAAKSALQALLDAAVNLAGFDVDAFLAGDSNLNTRTDILDFGTGATSDPTARAAIAAAEAEVRDALVTSLDNYIATVKAAVTNAANLSYASQGAEAVAARAAAVAAANAQTDRAEQLVDLAKAKSVVASAAADYADFINPEPENPDAALAALQQAELTEKQEIVADEGLISATAGPSANTIVITGNVPNQTFTVNVTATNGGSIDDNGGSVTLTTATTATGGQVTTVTIQGTPEIGDTYTIAVSANLDSTSDVVTSGTVSVTVDADTASIAGLRAALTQALNFEATLGGAEGLDEAAAFAAAEAAAAKTAADLAAYNAALGFADAAESDAAAAAQHAATAAELALTAQQAAQDAATAEAANNASAAEAAAVIAETAAAAALIAQQNAEAAAASAELNGNRAIQAAAGAGSVVVGGTSTSASAQANRASQAASNAAAAAGAALQSLDNAEASADNARADADLQDAEDRAADLAQQAAADALAAADQAAADAQAAADQAAADRAAAEALAAEEAGRLADEAEALASDNDPATQDAAQASATAQALAQSNVPGAADLAADAAEAARNAANQAQTAADAAQQAALGKGSAAQTAADRAQAAATAAAVSAGEAEAAAQVAADADAAVASWTSGEASTDRASTAIAARDAAAAAARAASAAETAIETADQAVADAVAPNVALAAAEATVTSRTSSLEQVRAERTAADDGDDNVDTAIEQVWDNAVAQAEQALSDAQDALAQAQAAADAANEAVTIAQANANTAAQAAAEAATQAAQAASEASFAAAFEINAQGAAQTRVDNFLDDLVTEVGEALTTAKAQAAIASQQAAAATAAAAEATLDADAATEAAEAAATAAQAALDALLQAAADLNLPLSAQTASAVVTAINSFADDAAALDDLAGSITTTDNLRAAQDAADTTQNAAVASIKAAAASALQAVNAANAALQTAQSQAAVASAGEAERDAARADAAEAALAQAKADAQAAADQAAADAAEAASAQAAAQTRVSDAQAAVTAATAARSAATTASQAAADALTSLTQAQTALTTAQTEAADAQAAFTASAAAQSIDPAAYQSVKQANDRAQAALQDALDAVADAQAAYTSASEAAATANTAATTAETAAATVNLAAAQAALATATAASTAATTASNTAAAAAADAAALTSPGGTAAEIQAVATQAGGFADAAETAATTAAAQADAATSALAAIPRAASARTTAQAAADEAQAAASTAEGVAQTDTVTLSGTVEAGDTYSVTVDGDVVSVTVTTETTIDGIRDALIQAINTEANGATDSVVASAGSGDGLITLTAAMPGIGFTATASATNTNAAGSVDDQSASSATTVGNLGGATQVAQLDTVTLQGSVEAGDVFSVTINGTTISITAGTQTGGVASAAAVRDALVSAINNSNVASSVTAEAGDTSAELTITADVAGVGFTASAAATNGGADNTQSAQSTTTTANLRGADDLAAQAATDAQAAASTATTESANAQSAAQTAAASIAAKAANDDAVQAASDAATQATAAKQAAADGALYARTAKAVGDAVSTALSGDPSSLDSTDFLNAIQAQLETTQVSRVTLAGSVEAGDKFTITIGSTQATFTVTTQSTLTEVRDAFIQQLTTDGTFNGLATVSTGSTAESIRLTGATAGTAFTVTAGATNAANGTNDQAARVQRQVNADQVTQQDTLTVNAATNVADGDSFSVEIAGTTVTVSTAGGEINPGDDADAVRDALVSKIQAAITGGSISGLSVAAGGSGQLVLTASTAGAAGGFLTLVPEANAAALSVDAISNGSIADRAAQSAADANTAAQNALSAANQAGTDAATAQTAAQTAANLPGAGSVAQSYLTDTQSQVSATNTSVASAVRDAAAAAQSAASAQAQADLAGADVGAIAAAIEAANTAAVAAADEDADTAAEAAEAAFSQATASATDALTKAQSAITDGADMLQLATSFDQVTLTGTPAAGDQFTLTIDPTPGNPTNGDAVVVTVTAADGDTINDVRDALVSAANNTQSLQGVAAATATSGDGGLIIAAATDGASIGVTVTEDGAATGAESASAEILAALTAADAAQGVIDGLFNGDLPNDAGTQTANALDNVVTALDTAIAATRQQISITLGGTLETGDTLTVNIDTNNDGTADVITTITIGADTGGSTSLAAVRDALVSEIGSAGGLTAAAAFQDGELVLISDNPAASFIRVTASATNADGVANEAPTISVARTGTEAALRALRNGLDQASTVAETIQNAVDDAGEAATFARLAASGGSFDPGSGAVDFLTGLDPTTAANTIAAANTVEQTLTGSNSTTFDFVSAAEYLAEVAESYVPEALEGAATANAQATIAQQAAFQAAAGLSQFQQAIIKARNEADLKAQQEARDSAPVAGDEVIGDGETDNGAPVGASADGDDVALEDQAVTFDVLGNDTRADGNALSNATIASVGQPAHGRVTIVREVEEFEFSANFADGDKVTLTVNGVSVTYTLDGGLNAEQNANLFVTQINNDASMASVVSAAGAARGGAITLTSAVPGTPINVSGATPVNTGGFTTSTTPVVPNGRVTYTPDANYSGNDTFTYTVSNGATPPAFDTATVTVQVTAVNDNPDAKNDFATTSGDTASVSKAAASGLLSNDTDIDTGDSLSIIKVNASAGNVGTPIAVTLTLPDNSTAQALVTINNDGSFTVNPNGQFDALAAGQSATGTLTYTVSDGHDGTDDQTLALGATQANVAAVSQVSTVTIAGTPETGDTFTIDINGTALTFTVGAQSTLAGMRNAFINAINANSTLNGIVTASAGGTDGDIKLTAKAAGGSFTINNVSATDNGAASGITISDALTTAAVSPVAQVSTYTVGGTVERGDVFEITVNGTRISHTVTTETTVNEVRDALITKLNDNSVIAGKATASAGGSGEVVVTANVAGQAFTTSGQAINSGTDVATLTVTVTGSNSAPTANADTASGNEDTTINGTLTATDPDIGDSKTFSLAAGGQATNGTVTVNSDGTFSYVPTADFSGTDSFTFRVVDSAGASSTATVTLTVTAVNDDPVTAPDAATTDSDTPVTISVRLNDEDAEDARADLTVAVETSPSYGTVSVNGATGTITYTPDTANTSVINIPDGGTLTDTFTYRLTDTDGGYTIETVTVTINGGNDAPTTTADTVNVNEGAAVTFDPRANDVDPDGDTLSLNGNAPTATYGTVTYNADDTITYTTDDSTAVNALAQGETLNDTFTYTVSDGNGELVQETVTVTITGVNDDPNAANDTRAAQADRTDVVIDVLANDTDADSDDDASSLTITSATSSLGGTVTVNTSAQPQAQSNLVTIGGTVEDGDVYSVTVGPDTFTVTVGTDTPAAAGISLADVRDALAALIDASNTVHAVAGATDGAIVVTGETAGSPYTISATSTNAGANTNSATVSLRNPAVSGRESLSYDPSGAGNLQALARGDSVIDTITYTIQDSHGATSTATVQVTITGVNDAPVTASDTADATKDGAVAVIDVLANDTDPDTGDTLTVTDVTTADLDPAGGAIDLVADGIVTLSGTPGGTISFDPTTGAFDTLAEGEAYPVSITYTVTDSEGASTQGTLTVTVTGTNDAPVAAADTANATENGAVVNIDVLANDDDIDSDDDYTTLDITAVDATSASGATVAIVTTPQYQQDGLEFSDTIEIGDVFSVTVNGITVDYTVSGGETMADITYNLATSLNSHGTLGSLISASDDGPLLLISSLSMGTPFTTTAAVTDGGGTDDGAVTVETLTPALKGVSIDYDPSSTSAFESLAAGETATDTFTYTVTDSHGATSTQTVTVTVTGTNDDPVVTASGAVAEFEENISGAVFIDPGLTVTDVDQVSGVDADMDGGILTVSISANGTTNDLLDIGTTADITTSGSNVLYQGTIIGTYTGGGDGITPADLVITLNADADPAAVQALAQAVTYDNLKVIPDTTDRDVTFSLSDGDGGTGSDLATVQVQLEGGLTRNDFDNTNVNNDWFDAGNWSAGVIPGATDVAILNADATFDTTSGFNSGSLTQVDIAKLLINPATTLTVSQGTLDISGNSEVDTGGSLLLGAVTVQGTGFLNVKGAMTMAAGDFAMAGLNVAASGTLGIAGIGNTITSSVATEAGGQIAIAGSAGDADLTITGNVDNEGSFVVDNDHIGSANTVITVSGILTNTGNLSFDDTAGGGGNRILDAEIDNTGGVITVNSPATIENAGHTFTTDAGTIDLMGSTYLVINGGDTVIGAGTVLGDNASANIDISGTAFLSLSGDATLTALDPALTFGGGSGQVTIRSTDATVRTLTYETGTVVTMDGDAIDATAVLAMDGQLSIDSLVLDGALNVGGFTDLAGGAITGTGQITVVSGGQLDFNTTGNSVNPAVTIDAGGILNTGLSGGVGGSADVTFLGTLTNNGTLAVTNDTASSNTTVTLASGTLLNAGTLHFANASAATGDRIFVGEITNTVTGVVQADVDATIVNTGQFDVSTGTITVGGTSKLTIDGGTTVIGTGTTLTDNSGAVIDFINGATLALDSDTGVVAADPTITFGGPSDAITVTTVDAGPYTFDIDTGALLTLTGGDVFDTTVDLNVAGDLEIEGAGNAINGGLYIAGTGALSVTAYDTGGDAVLNVAQGFVNDGVIRLNNEGPAVHDATLAVASGAIDNFGTILIEDTSAVGGMRTVSADINNSGGTIDIDTDATFDLTGKTLDTSTGNIDVGASTLTIVGGETIVAGDTYLIGTGTIDLTGVSAFTLGGNFIVSAGGPDLTFSGSTTISGSGGPHTLTVADGKTLTLDGETVESSVQLDIAGILDIQGTDTIIDGAITLQGPNGVLNVPAGATVAINGPITNTDGAIHVAAGGTLILTGANIDNSGVISGDGTIQLAGGAQITGDGVIDIADIGTGTLTIDGGALDLNAGAVINIDITSNATPGSSHDVLDLTPLICPIRAIR
jgi:VCBS repeat-containing protein